MFISPNNPQVYVSTGSELVLVSTEAFRAQCAGTIMDVPTNSGSGSGSRPVATPPASPAAAVPAPDMGLGVPASAAGSAVTGPASMLVVGALTPAGAGAGAGASGLVLGLTVVVSRGALGAAASLALPVPSSLVAQAATEPSAHSKPKAPRVVDKNPVTSRRTSVLRS
jgi:hypothetical protein